MKDILISTNAQKILAFMCFHTEKEEWYESEIAKRVEISVGSAHGELRDLKKRGILDRNNIGKTVVYRLKTNAVTQVYKKLVAMLNLQPLVSSLRSEVQRIILFGSYSRGEQVQGSDFDLLVVANKKDKIIDAVNKFWEKFKFDDVKLQLIVKTPVEWIAIEEKDPTFFKEVLGGILIWDKQKDGERF